MAGQRPSHVTASVEMLTSWARLPNEGLDAEDGDESETFGVLLPGSAVGSQ